MFLDGVIHQVAAFTMKAGVEPADVSVRLVFNDGDYVVFQGLQVLGPFGGTDWGMILNRDDGLPEAVLIREQDIHKVQLRLAAAADTPIGFEAETEANSPAR